jgi:hypothetical protein
MAGIDADIWVCGECRSINALRAKQCYRCRTPRDVAAVDPNEIEGTGHGRLREIALPEFRSSRGAAVLASALLIFLPVMQIVSTAADAVLFGRLVRDPALLADPAFARSTESLVAGSVAIATLGVALLALTAWAFWLSRVVMAMPALGLGYPAANGLMAFVENFLPGLNLFRVPAIVRDVIRRLEPESLRGEVLIFAAWIGLLGGYIVPRLGGYLGLFGSGTLEEIVDQTILVQAVASGMVALGATFLVALIWWIERRIARRRVAQLEGEAVSGSPSDLRAEASVAAAPVATYRVEEDPEFVATREVAAEAPAPVASAGAPAREVAAAAPGPEDAAGGPAPAGAAAQDQVLGPRDAAASATPAHQMLNRSITAVTGAASTPTPPTPPTPATPEPPAAAAFELPTSPSPVPGGQPDDEPIPDATPASHEPTEAPETPVEEPAAHERPIEATAATSEAASEAAGSAVEPEAATATADQGQATTDQGTAGPQLHLRIESATSMVATVEGESEPITLEELRSAAEALARANGSAVIATDGTSFGALSLAEQAFEVLSDANVPTNVQD